MFKNTTVKKEIRKKYAVGDKVTASTKIKTIGTKYVTCISYMNGYSEFRTELQEFYLQHVL